MLRGSIVRRVVLSGFVLIATATVMISGVAAAAPSTPAQVPASPHAGARLEAVVLDSDQSNPVPVRSDAEVTGLPDKPLPPAPEPLATKAAPKRAAAPRPVRAKVRTAKPTSAHAPTARGGSALSRAVARIPGYSAHRPTRWVSTSKYGHWGATDLGSGTVYISPSVPASRLDDVVRHEWSHVLAIRVYGSASATIAGLDAYFGGSGMVGVERAADCMARQLGATWTNYTSCSSAAWQRGAAHLLQGRRP
jgi:hypothetical protein